MKIGWYAGCTALVSLIGLGGFWGLLMPQLTRLSFQRGDAVQVIQIQDMRTDGFPVRIGETPLIAERLVKYEGDMFETGSDTFLVNAAALELRNTGPEEILTAELRLTCGETVLTFFGTNIPAGAHIVIVERSGKDWTDEGCTGCTGRVQYEQELYEDRELTAVELDKTTLAITNISDHVKKDIWIYYKDYLEDSDLYVGGITYLYQVPQLQPGQVLHIRPDKYVSGYSKVVKLVALEP